MKRKKLHILFAVSLFILLLAGCSTKKNTWLSRNYQGMVTKYNVSFNGYESYKEGLKSINTANQDDYSNIIPMYPISNHSNATAATSNMDRAIEKSRKGIKTHSIKQKPKRDVKKWDDPVYQAFYQQGEFNAALQSAWMLIGKAEFHKADFLGSIGTFTYIAKHYAYDKDLVAQCQLWMVRAYVEMDWMYEAEEMLGKVNQDNLKYSNIGLFAATNAVYLLKREQYKEAIPFVELALSKEKNKVLKQRFSYVLAQLYQVTGNKEAAIRTYTSLLKMNPPYIMDFNARINRAELSANHNLSSIVKELKKMVKNPNNKDYLDQLYYAIGNAYLQNGDTVKAIENYNLSAESSTRNGVEKAVTLIKLGDLYYSEKEYIKAQPPYGEASNIITNENKDYARVTKLAEVLDELNVEYEVVVLQDSLQYLATLSKEDQLKVINKVIEDLIANEKKAEEKAQEQARKEAEDAEKFVPTGGPLGPNAGKWYFYNPNLIRTGKSEFQKKWGSRKLEDNWRRATKSSGMFGSDAFASETAVTDSIEAGMEGETVGTEEMKQPEEVLDDKNPEFYLRQIPATPEQIKLSDTQIANGLFNMGMIYKDKINDIPMAIKTYQDFIRRFGEDARIPDAYFQLYLMETKQENTSEADLYRIKIISDYPDTKYAQILLQPDYIARFALMQKQQDSLYSATYQAYSKNDFKTVSQNVAYAKANYPLSKLMPKFIFLEALSIGKTDTPEHFEIALNNLIAAYPQSDVSAMAKDIAALIRQGNEAKAGTSHGTLLTRREDELKAEQEQMQETTGKAYSAEKQSKHRLLLISDAPQQDMYQLMYQVAAFNFTRFMIKEFDLSLSKLDEKRQALSITNFESYDEVVWYENSINSDLTIGEWVQKLNIQEVIISEDNFALLNLLGLEEYVLFEAQQLKSPAKAGAEAKGNNKGQAGQKPVVAVKPKETAAPVQPKEAQVTPETTTKPVATEPVVAEPVVTEPEKTAVAEGQTNTPPVQEITPPVPVTPAPVIVVPEEPKVPLYKGLFAYEPEKPHLVALYVISGKINFEKIKADFDAYNAENYSMLNLNVSVQAIGSQQIILIGNFADANIAKSYLLRIVKEKTPLEGLKGTNYRNLLGTEKNLNTMTKNNALRTYSVFMDDFYLK